MTKKVLQCAALLVVALLAAQPALAGMSCAMGMPAGIACAPDCGMAMAEMGMNCPMPYQLACDGCAPECCRPGVPQVATQLTGHAKPKAVAAAVALLAPVMASPERSAVFSTPPGSISGDPPPIYLRNRVFRI